MFWRKIHHCMVLSKTAASPLPPNGVYWRWRCLFAGPDDMDRQEGVGSQVGGESGEDEEEERDRYLEVRGSSHTVVSRRHQVWLFLTWSYVLQFHLVIFQHLNHPNLYSKPQVFNIVRPLWCFICLQISAIQYICEQQFPIPVDTCKIMFLPDKSDRNWLCCKM